MGPCDICGEQPQSMQIGNMQSGEQQFVCAGCFARFGLDFAKAILPPEEIAAIVGPMFVDPAREDLHEEAKSQRRARKSKAATEPEQPAENPPGPAEPGGVDGDSREVGAGA